MDTGVAQEPVNIDDYREQLELSSMDASRSSPISDIVQLLSFLREGHQFAVWNASKNPFSSVIAAPTFLGH